MLDVVYVCLTCMRVAAVRKVGCLAMHCRQLLASGLVELDACTVCVCRAWLPSSNRSHNEGKRRYREQQSSHPDGHLQLQVASLPTDARELVAWSSAVHTTTNAHHGRETPAGSYLHVCHAGTV